MSDQIDAVSSVEINCVETNSQLNYQNILKAHSLIILLLINTQSPLL